MTRVGAALVGLTLTACGGPTPAAVTVAPIPVASAKAPEPVPERYDDLGCGVFAKDGASPSATALRRCLERTAPEDACTGGGSPDLSTLELSVAMIDGTGGPVDVPRARKLLEGCFVDVSVDAVLEHAARKEKDPTTAPLDSCDAYAQTTLAMTECATEHTQNERAWLRRIRRDLAPDVRPLFDAATHAYDVYAEKLGTVEYERYAGGTLRSPAMASKVLFLLHERRMRVAAIASFVPGRVTSEDLAAARDETLRAFSAAHDAEPEAVEAVEAASKTWLAYRGAEIALYERVHPGSRDAVILLLGREHAKDLCGTVPP
jgi:hypothetical protein